MAYPFPARKPVQPPQTVRAPIPPHPDKPNEWRCLECHKLLGIRSGASLHIRIHGHDYTVNLPVDVSCRGCGAFNQT